MKTRWAFIAALAVATLLAYSNGLSTPFVFDDQGAIVENETIRTLSPLARALHPPRQLATAGRPLVNLSLAVNYAAGGLSPWGYHAWNLGVHLLCGLLVFGIVWRTIAFSAAFAPPARVAVSSAGRTGRASPRGVAPASHTAGTAPPTAIAFACALLWLLHPLQTEVIGYTIQRTESMMALAYLATLYSALRAMTSKRPPPWIAAAIAACAAGMLCKESMVTAPVTVLIFDAVFFAGSLGQAIKKRGVLHGGLAATWTVLAAMVVSGPRSNSAGFSSGVGPWTYLLNQAPVIVRYVRTALWPTSLVFDYGLPHEATLQQVILPGVLVVALIVAAAAAWRVHRPLAFLGAWFFVTLSPTSSVVPIATEVGAERRMYLPLLAIVVALVVATSRVVRRQQVLLAVVAPLALVLGVLTVQRMREYADPAVLWTTVLDRYPQSRARYQRGLSLKAEGRLPEAMREFETASTDLADADYALGFELAEQGQHDRAIAHLEKYVGERPLDVNAVRAYVLLGRSWLAQKQFVKAEGAFRQVLRMRAGHVDALGGLADSLLLQQRWAEASSAYREYIRHVQTNSTPYYNLGLALLREGRPEDAIAPLTRGVAIAPRDPGLRANLGSALASTGRISAAIEQYRRLAELDPDLDIQRQVAETLRSLEAQEKGTSR